MIAKKRRTVFIKKLILGFIACIYMLPVILMLLGSLKTQGEAIRFDLSLPEVFQWKNYQHVLEKGNVINGYLNSIFYSVFSTGITLIFGAFAGVYVGRNKKRISDVIYNYFIFGLTVSFQIATTFALLKILNIYGSRMAVVLIYAAMNLPFTVMTFASFIKGVPVEIDEAGIIDGCSPMQLIFRILFPILKPTMVTNLIVVMINAWNNFMVPLFYLDSGKKWPIPLMIYNFYGRYVRSWNYVFAMLVVTIVPIIILYLCLQKYIVAGMTAGAVKG